VDEVGQVGEVGDGEPLDLDWAIYVLRKPRDAPSRDAWGHPA
jgi:hypothetical protein